MYKESLAGPNKDRNGNTITVVYDNIDPTETMAAALVVHTDTQLLGYL